MLVLVFGDARKPHVLRMLSVAALLFLVLLWPALLNRLPHFFPDSGGYLYVGWGNLWLLDRSSFYGVAIRPFVMSTDILGLWLALLPQLIAVTCLLYASANRLGAAGWPIIVAVILTATTGPWHTSQLMPDAFAGAIIMLGWICATRDPSAPGSPLLWLAAAAICLTHSTYPAILVASVVGSLIVLWLRGLSRKEVGARLIGLAVTVSFTVAIQIAANAYFFHRATYSPRSAAFLYASLNEDGIIEPWLKKHCATDRRVRDLCAIAPQFPRDSQKLLWSEDSIVWETVWKQRDNQPGIDWDTQLGIAARGALFHSPGKFALAAIEATTEQFFSYQVLDDECPKVCLAKRSAIQGALSEYRPNLKERVNSSKQIRGELRTGPLLAVTGATSHLGLLGLFLLLAIAIKRRDGFAASLLVSVIASFLANAFVTGTLSDVHDRYQSRVIWIAPVVVALILLRWRAEARSVAQGINPGPAPAPS